jgi:hypothetical protein
MGVAGGLLAQRGAAGSAAGEVGVAGGLLAQRGAAEAGVEVSVARSGGTTPSKGAADHSGTATRSSDESNGERDGSPRASLAPRTPGAGGGSGGAGLGAAAAVRADALSALLLANLAGCAIGVGCITDQAALRGDVYLYWMHCAQFALPAVHVAWLSALAAPRATEASLSARFLASRPLRELGRVSYALYCLHWPLLI